MLTARAAPQPSSPMSTAPGEPAAAKSALRRAARQTRCALATDLTPALAGTALAERLLPWLRARQSDAMSTTCLAGYIPVGAEIDPCPALVEFARLGGQVALPVVVAKSRPLAFRAWSPLVPEALTPGLLGIPEPCEGRPVIPDIVLVPLLAFDRQRRRLGQGGGYYDRTLAALKADAAAAGAVPPVFVGVAYAGQEYAEVPAEPHDVTLDAIATEAYLLMG